jgi:glycosyltransferase involved in cell wall biosynthesis
VRRLALRSGRPARSGVRVLYGLLRPPREDEPAWGGGLVHVVHLMRRYPPAQRDFNVYYLVSSTLGAVPDCEELVRLARRRGAAVVLNQNGIPRPEWGGYAPDHPDVGPAALRRTARLIHGADHVFFQSRFVEDVADRMVGPRQGPCEVLHNAVDVERFTPAPAPPPEPLRVLVGGNQVHPARLGQAVRVFARVLEEVPGARLLVAGAVHHPEDDLIRELGVGGALDRLGPYALRDAPDVYRRAHVLLHPQVNDPCPNTVIEAMACGLPVVHALSGGVPELVGPGGVGVEVEQSWEREVSPDPDALAEAVLDAFRRRPELAAVARAEAVARLSLPAWLDRHTAVLEALRRA